MDIYARRRSRLAMLVEQKAQGNVAEFARAHGYSRSQISQFLSDTYNNGRSIGERAARTIDERVGNPAGWLDLPLSEPEMSALRFPFSTAELRVATNQTRPIDSSPHAPYLARIPIVADLSTNTEGVIEKLDFYEKDFEFLEYYTMENAQAARINGWGLRPRIKSGEYLVVDNGLEPRPGDDVLMMLKDERVLVIQFLFERDGEKTFGSLRDGSTTVIVKDDEILTCDVIILVVHRGARTFREET